MAKYQGVKEKLHFPIYDAFLVKKGEGANQAQTFMEAMNDPRMIRFFVDVQNKTKLETNLQSSGVLPSQNTLEVRAMRVVVSPVLAAVNTDKDSGPRAKTSATGNDTEHNRACADSSLILSELVYNSVTTLLVGEKIMIEAPTWYFPGGAGVHPGSGRILTA